MIFVLNSGSSSLKFRLFDPELGEAASGMVERIGLDQPIFSFTVGFRSEKKELKKVADHAAALEQVFAAVKGAGFPAEKFTGIGHRVVHGGEEFTEAMLIDDANLKRLRAYNQLAPLHNPANLAGIDACRRIVPDVPNIAVFDTAFYRTMPDYAFMYSLPWELYAKYKIRKYGFHGISHRFVTEEAARVLQKPISTLRLVSCHLGSGSSVTAVKNGAAVDTSMGFTPLEGLTMATRCGDLDAEIPLYLMRELKYKLEDVETMFNQHSGLLGISGFKDMREVLAAAGIQSAPGFDQKKISGDQRNRSRLAFDMFCYDVARYVGQFAAIIGGADAVIFTGGIGERSEVTRKRIMGMVELPGKPQTMVVPTNEERMIAIDVRAVLDHGRTR